VASTLSQSENTGVPVPRRPRHAETLVPLLSPSLADWVDARVPSFESIAEVLPRKAAPAVVPTQARRAVWTHAALHAAVVRWAGAGAGRAGQILLMLATSHGGPGRYCYCSPHHRMPFNSTDEGSNAGRCSR